MDEKHVKGEELLILTGNSYGQHVKQAMRGGGHRKEESRLIGRLTGRQAGTWLEGAMASLALYHF